MICVASWNVNSVRARLPLLLRWLGQENPDIVLLQEIKVETAAFPYEAIEDLGYNTAVFGEKTYNGVAILSKFPLEDIRTNFLIGENKKEWGSRYVEAFTGGLRVGCVYVPNGQQVESQKFLQKKDFFEALRRHVQEILCDHEVFVLGGDFNVAPFDEDVYDADLWKEKLLCSTLERSWWRALIYLGLTDPLAPSGLSGEKSPFTWWDYRAGCWEKNNGLRIDHFLLSPLAADLCQDAGVHHTVRGWEKTSDHAPLWVRLAL